MLAVTLCLFTAVIGATVAIIYATLSLECLASYGDFKIFFESIVNEKKTYFFFLKSTFNSMKYFIFKTLIDYYTSHAEFIFVINETQINLRLIDSVKMKDNQ